MRRRGRAQDSTEGPDGPRLGYAPSEGDGYPQTAIEWLEALGEGEWITGALRPYPEAFHALEAAARAGAAALRREEER